MGFDSDIVAAVAADRDLDVAELGGALADLQALVAGHAEVGGVDGLVYEWRRSFRRDPLLKRTPDRYYLVVEPRVWTDFEERLDLGENVGGAVREVHARTLRQGTDGIERGEPIVFDRE